MGIVPLSKCENTKNHQFPYLTVILALLFAFVLIGIISFLEFSKQDSNNYIGGNLIYFKDERTNLCFAKWLTGEILEVQCTDLVLQNIKE